MLLTICKIKRHNNIKEMELIMPELSRFHGIVITMLFKDIKQHNKPHVHITYGEYEASVGIDG